MLDAAPDTYPERRLWQTVLLQVLRDAAGDIRKHRDAALQWLAEADEDMQAVCEGAGVDWRQAQKLAYDPELCGKMRPSKDGRASARRNDR